MYITGLIIVLVLLAFWLLPTDDETALDLGVIVGVVSDASNERKD